MFSRLTAVGFSAVLAAMLLIGCGDEQTPGDGPDGVTGPTGRPEPVDEPEVQRGPPLAGRYDSHTPAALAAGVQQAVGKKDFLGLIKLMESEARFKLTRNSKDWFFAAMRVMPGTEKSVLEAKGLTRSEFNLMDEEHYTAYEMWHGRSHQELIRQLSGRFGGIEKSDQGVAVIFERSTDDVTQAARFFLKRTDRGWRIIVPGEVTAVPRPTTAPASRPTTVPTTQPAVAPVG